MLVVARISAILFWTMFYVLLSRYISSWFRLIMGGLLVVAHPAAFYLQVGYSESVFLSALLVLLWAVLKRPPSLVVGAISGFLMTSARIIGAPLALIGFGASFLQILWAKTRKWKLLWPQAFIAILSLLGVGSFLVLTNLLIQMD